MGSCFSGISMKGKSKLQYWPIYAKNMAPAIALELGGFDWEEGLSPGSKGTGNLMGEWMEMKPSTVWAYLPNLILPGGEVVGTELSILQWLGRKSSKLGGSSDKDFIISQELMHQAEELYQKFTKLTPTIFAKDTDPGPHNKFMTSTNKGTHSKEQGLPVYLMQFEDFFVKRGGKDGKFTSSGITVGEIKLYATLRIGVMIKADILASFPNLSAFYKRLDEDPKVKGVFEGTLKGKAQYFISPPN